MGSNDPTTITIQQLCRRGHRTDITGRYSSGRCRVCQQQDSRRNEARNRAAYTVYRELLIAGHVSAAQERRVRLAGGEV